MTASIGNSVFEASVLEKFDFLVKSGYSIAIQDPTLITFTRRNILVDVYHGRRSEEIGIGLTVDDERFSLSELIRLNDEKLAEVFRNPLARDEAEIRQGVSKVAELLLNFGCKALEGDGAFLSALTTQRQARSLSYELDVLADQTRPLAEQAFRVGEYAEAAKLYARMSERLTRAEKAKLRLAKARSATRH